MHYNRDFGIECRIARFHNIYGPYGTWKGGREKAPAAFCRKVGSDTHIKRPVREELNFRLQLLHHFFFQLAAPLLHIQWLVRGQQLLLSGAVSCDSFPGGILKCQMCLSGACFSDLACPVPCKQNNTVPLLCVPVALVSAKQVLTSKSEIEMWGDGKQTRSFTYIDDCVEGILRVTKSDFREPLNLGSSEMVSMNEMMQLAMGFEDKVRQKTGAWGCVQHSVIVREVV